MKYSQYVRTSKRRAVGCRHVVSRELDRRLPPTSPLIPFTTTATSIVDAWSAVNDPKLFTARGAIRTSATYIERDIYTPAASDAGRRLPLSPPKPSKPSSPPTSSIIRDRSDCRSCSPTRVPMPSEPTKSCSQVHNPTSSPPTCQHQQSPVVCERVKSTAVSYLVWLSSCIRTVFKLTAADEAAPAVCRSYNGVNTSLTVSTAHTRETKRAAESGEMEPRTHQQWCEAQSRRNRGRREVARADGKSIAHIE